MHQRALGDEQLYRVAVGDDDSTGYYVERFLDFDSDDNPVSWSWPAFWASFLWFVHRRMYAYAFGYLIAIPAAVFCFGWVMTQVLGPSAGKFFYSGAMFAAAWVAVPLFANSLYHRHINARIEKAAAKASSREELLETLSRQRATTHPLIIVAILLVAGLGAITVALGPGIFQVNAPHRQIAEGLELAKPVQAAVERAHAESGEWPEDLAAAKLADADYQSKYVTSIDVIDGMVLIYYGNQADAKISGRSLSLRPALLNDGVIWACGFRQHSEGDSARGTGIHPDDLPSECLPPRSKP